MIAAVTRAAVFLIGICLCTISTAETLIGLSQSVDLAVDARINAYMQDSQIPGVALAVLERGALRKAASYGLANVELGVAVTRQSVFELASVTKQFTGAAVLRLVGEDRIALDAPLTRYLENTPEAWSAITIRQLLVHRAGLAHRFEEKHHDSFLMDYSTENMLASAMHTPMQSESGTDWSYSDQGYFLLGLVIEKVTGQTYAQYLTDQFFTPLGMTATRRLEQAAVIPRRVAGYTLQDGTLENDRRDWQFGQMAHFGILSTLDDLIRWDQGLADGTALPEMALQTFFDPLYLFQEDPATESLIGYGYGWWIEQANGVRVAHHSGYTGTVLLRVLDRGLTVIILTNLDQPSGPGTINIAWDVAQLVDPDLARPQWSED